MSDMASAEGRLRAEVVAKIAERLERLPFTRYQLMLLAVIATAWLFDSVDLGAITFLLGSIKADFHLTTALAGAVSSISFAGMVLGASLAGIAADRFGRKALFQISMIFWGVGSILCGVAPTLQLLMAARVVVGFGMGMEFPIAQSIASELLPARHRGRSIAILEGFWPLGFIVAGLIALAFLSTLGWRAVFIVEGIPFLFVFIVRRAIPESPRWLADHGLFGEAESEMGTIEAKVEQQLRKQGKELPQPKPFKIILGAKRMSVSVFDLWSKTYRRRTAMIWLLWFFALLGYYGLTTWLSALLQRSGYPVTKSVYYTVLISLAGIPGFLTAAILIEIIGRRVVCVATLLGGAAAAYLYGTAANQNQLIAFGLAMQFCLFGMWSVMYAYTPELYPTHIRATGTGVASAIGRIGALIGPYFVGVILPKVGDTGVFAFGAASFVLAALSVLILGEETKGKTLETLAPTAG
jgi:putative MFS transporter